MSLDAVMAAALRDVVDWDDYARAIGELASDYRPPSADVSEHAAPGPRGPVRIRVYRPRARTTGAPGLLWVHGGGFTAGDIDMAESDVVARELVARAGAVVASVDYRLAGPETRFPAPLEDVEAAWAWFTRHADDVGTDPARLSLGGCSAGGNLAAATALRLVDGDGPRPEALVLGYPLLHFPVPAVEIDGRDDLPEILRFRPARNAEVLHGYVGRSDDPPADAMPGSRAPHGLPPTLLALSEMDELRGSGELFARQLHEAGIPVQVEVARGMPHGHLNIPPVDALPEVGRTLDAIARVLATENGERMPRDARLGRIAHPR